METLRENYPPFAYYSAMNSLGTHDTPRILTLLGVGSECRERSREWRASLPHGGRPAPPGQGAAEAGGRPAVRLPRLPPPCTTGMRRGWRALRTPSNRRTFPWGREDYELLGWFTRLGHLRQECPALRRGDIRYRAAQGSLLAFTRSAEGETILAAFNTGGESAELRLEDAERIELLLGSARFQISAQGHVLTLPPRTGSLLKLSVSGDGPQELD